MGCFIPIANEPVSSINLMEQAATACLQLAAAAIQCSAPYAVFLWQGNNGGDGLAIARLLIAQKHGYRLYTEMAKTVQQFYPKSRSLKPSQTPFILYILKKIFLKSIPVLWSSMRSLGPASINRCRVLPRCL